MRKNVLKELLIFSFVLATTLSMTSVVSVKATEIDLAVSTDVTNSQMKANVSISSNTVCIEQATSPDYTFTTIDGTTISATGSGKKATVLVFGKADICSNTYGVLQGISASNWVKSSNIRVAYVDINTTATAEGVKTLKETYGCDEMIFCYGQENSSRMFNYLSLAGQNTSSVTMPVVVIIDENNEIKSVLSGYTTAGSILNEINEFYESGYSVQEDTVFEMPISGTEMYSYAKEVFDIVNEERADKGLSALQLDQELMETAMIRARETAYYWSHQRPNGESCFTIFPTYTNAGENIAGGQTSPEDVMISWMNSTGHRENILSSNYNSIGIGCFVSESGTIYWTQCFANRSVTTASLPEDRAVNTYIDLLKDYVDVITGNSKTMYCSTSLKFAVTQYNHFRNEIMPASAFNYTSSDETIATVNTNGIITFKDLGTVTVTAVLKSDSTISSTYTVTRTHDLYYTKEKAATTTSKGRQGYYTCCYCGSYFKDSAGKTIITDLSTLDIPMLSSGSDTTNSTTADNTTTDNTTTGNTTTDNTTTGNTTAAIKNKPLAKGKKFTKSNARYKVTSSSKTNPTVQYMYYKKKNAKSVTIPSYVTYKNIKYKVTSIASEAFRNNKKITKVVIGSQVQVIGARAFQGCKKLSKVTIGTRLTEIKKYAFKDCKKLKSITIKSKKLKKVGTKAFSNIYSKCVIKVPSSKVKAYKKIMKNKGQKKSVKIK